MSDDDYMSPRERDDYFPAAPSSPRARDDSDCSDEDMTSEQKWQYKTGLLLLGAAQMSDDNPYKSVVLPAAEKLFERAMAEKCEHCQNSLPNHYYSCPLAQKCANCGARVDLVDVCHRYASCKRGGKVRPPAVPVNMATPSKPIVPRAADLNLLSTSEFPLLDSGQRQRGRREKKGK